ncbi:MAG: SDR family oxidoreductase [Aquisalimonadaceae bacterium]
MSSPVTLVTGSSRGIGEATARKLSERGHLVIGTGRKRPSNAPGPFYEVDFSDAEETARVLEEIASAHAVDNLVNNAGVSKEMSLGETTVADMELHFAVNLRAAVQCAQAVLPGMRERRHGRIVNLASRVALGRADRTPYAAAKAGLIGLTRCWALELAEHGIAVNAIAPGPVKTELFSNNHPDGSEKYERLVATIPMKRPGDPDEIAGPIAFLLSDDASYMTGQIIYVCGGASVGSAAV